jgi:hypothetical protein
MFYVENIRKYHWLITKHPIYKWYHVIWTLGFPTKTNILNGDECYSDFDLSTNGIYNLKKQVIESSESLNQTIVCSLNNKDMSIFTTSKRLYGKYTIKMYNDDKIVIGI